MIPDAHINSSTGTTSSKDIEDLKPLLLDPFIIKAATQNFAEENKLGEGGFGQVYKVILVNWSHILAQNANPYIIKL